MQDASKGKSWMASDSCIPDLWAALLAVSERQVYPQSSTLFEQGEQARGVYMIVRGEVRVRMPEDGNRAVTTSLGQGTMLALSEAICDAQHKLSAVTLGEAEIGFVAKDALMNFLQSHHDLCMQVVRTLSEDLHSLYHRFQKMQVVSPRQRRTGTDRVH
jgi:CRP-like cAMP-binding protein